MIFDSSEVENGSTLRADVCIIGSGPAGASIALALRWAKLDVLLLESGGFDPELRVQDLYRGRLAGRRYFPLETCRMRYFGGSSNCWEGFCRPLEPQDFESRDWAPYSGWPFGREHLDPYYRRAERLLAVKGRSFDPEAWSRPGNPPWKLEGGRVVSGVIRFSRPVRFGGAFRHTLRAAKNVRVVLHASVVRLALRRDGGALRGLYAKRTLGGGGFRVEARRYVLACGGIENARILLASNDVRQAGVGNGRDLVGRFFMEHPHSRLEGLILASPRLPSQRFYELNSDKRGNSFWGYLTLTPRAFARERLLNFATGVADKKPPPDPLAKSLGRVIADMDAPDSPLPEQPSLLPLTTWSEQAPNPESRVTLIRDRDALGMPRVRLDWRLGGIDKHTVRRGHGVLAEDLGRSGMARFKLTLTDDPEFSERTSGGRHHMGTTRMHTDPKRGVVDANGAVHGVPNLLIAGSSVFPTSGSANPTLTIVALALRMADHLKKELA